MEEIHPKLVEIAIDKVGGLTFEQFGQEFYGAIRGRTFVPLGGTQDKGADGYVAANELAGGKPTEFVLMSVQEDARAKVRFDVARLKEVGRDPRTVVYLTSRVVKHVDMVENELTEELGVIVRIRDGRYLADHINDSAATRAAFENHLRGQVAFLRHVGRAPLLRKSKYVESPDVYVFLRQEVERTEGNASLVQAVIDALILWSLEGTDPASNKFMTRGEIIDKIESVLPSAGTFMHPAKVNNRLQAMASKSYPEGRAVHWRRKEQQLLLAFQDSSPHRAGEPRGQCAAG